MAGRTSKPAALRETSGPNRDRNHTKAEIEKMQKTEEALGGNSEKVSDVPDYLSDLGKEYYSFITKEMEVSGVLKNLDIPIVVQISETLAMIRECDLDINKDGLFYMEPDRNGRDIKKKNPAVDIRDKSVSQFKQLATQLGMTPASRSNLASLNIEKQKEEEDPLAKILNRKTR